jgi:hypothetical protein
MEPPGSFQWVDVIDLDRNPLLNMTDNFGRVLN